MGISRISSGYMIDRGLFNLQKNLLTTSSLQEKIASGRNISFPSDNAIGMAQLLRINLDAQRDSRFDKNISEGLSEMSAAETAVKGIVNVAHRARELATLGSNGTNSPSTLQAYEKEVDSLLQQLVQLGNTTYGGRYIFSGFQTDQPAFSIAGSDVTYDGSPSMGDFQRQVQVEKNIFVPLNFPGDQLLGEVSVTPGSPPTVAGSGLLYDLTKLKYDMQNGDFDGIRAGIDAIVASQTNVLNIQSELGNRMNHLELTKGRLDDAHIVQAREIAKIQEVDMPKVISELNFQQTIYQASLGMMSKIMETSLVNFLR